MSAATTTEGRRRPLARRRSVIVLVLVVVAVACVGGVIVWRSMASEPVSAVGTWQLVSVQQRDGPVTEVPGETDAYLEVDSEGMLFGNDGIGPLQGEYTITGDQLRVSDVVVGLIARPPDLPVRAYAQLFDEAASSLVTVAGDTLTVATTDYTLTFHATTPKVVVTPTPISPSPQP